MNIDIFISYDFLAQGASPGGGGIMSLLPMMLIMFGLMYFMMIRPQSQQRKKMAAMISALKTGDKVVTMGGIHGIVTSVKESSIVVKIADNTKVEFEKSGIARAIPKEKGNSVEETS